jgi:predicted aspartyl protease
VAAVTRRNYVGNFAYLHASGIIPNPLNGRQAPFNADCMVDTGFYGGIFLPDTFLIDARSIGVEPAATTVTLADGTDIVAHVCAGYLQSLENHDFAAPGKPIFVVIYGHEPGEIIGMNLLQYFSVLFDGPNNSLSLSV